MRALLDRLRRYYERNPARTLSLLAAVVVFVAAKAGLVLPEATVAQALSAVLPIIVGGQLIHDRVSPAPKLLQFVPTFEPLKMATGHLAELDTDAIAEKIVKAVAMEETKPPTRDAGA